jgi:c-di-GMP-related signal transduction protein
MRSYFVHKEPVLESNRRVFGQELIFRRTEPDSHGAWPPARVDKEVVRTVTSDGFPLLAGKRIFISVAADAVRMGSLSSLPRNCIFQVSGEDWLDKEVLLGSAVLRKKGYQVGAERGRLSTFHQVADFVRIDTHGVDPANLAAALTHFKGLPARKIATNVATAQAFRDCRDLGFDLFQGSFFMDPATRSQEQISDSQIQLLQLSKDLKLNKDVSVIEASFKNSPKLTYGLLQLINSAFFGVSVKVVAIRQAITLLGYDRLLKWVVLLLYGVSPGSEQANPVVEKAVVRGRVMETLARQVGQAVVADSAFITGMLSLFPVLFNIQLADLATEMKLGQEIRDALLTREGFLGILLDLGERMDFQKYEAMEESLSSMKLSTGDLLNAETDAIIDSQTRLFG